MIPVKPAYIRRWRNPRYVLTLLAILLVLAGLALLVVLLLRPRSKDVSTSLVGGDYISLKAAELEHSAFKVREFVRDRVAHEDYDGPLRGSVGTLWSGAGNEVDRATLLEALLAKCERREAGRPESAPFFEITLVADGARDVTGRIPCGHATLALIELTWREQDGRLAPVLHVAGADRVSPLDARKVARLEVELAVSGPGERRAARRREIFTREFPDYPVLLHPKNRHTFAVTTGWVPEWVREREVAWAQGLDRERALHHRLAYGFLGRADALARKAAAELGVRAWYVTPRVTIVGTDWRGEAGKETAAVTLDLRWDELRVEGPDAACIAFRSARSSLLAALESDAIRDAAGVGAISAAGLIADAWEGRRGSLPERVKLLERAIARVDKEGKALRVWPEGYPRHDILISKLDDTTLDALHDIRFPEPPLPEGTELLLGGRFALRLALQVEAAFAHSLNLGPQFELEFEFLEPTAKRWFERARFFTYSGAESSLAFEREFTSIEPGLAYDTVDYWDDINDKFNEPVLRGSWSDTKEEVDGAKVFTLWLHGNEKFRKGRTWDMISRAAFRELRDQGWTTLSYRNKDGEDTPALKLWKTWSGPVAIQLNNREFLAPAIFIEGNWAALDQPKPEYYKSPAINEKTDGWVINRWTVHDDPDYPFFIRPGDHVQSTLPGRITDARTKRGIAFARVEIAGEPCVAEAWPDGRFTLPLIPHEFREFEVRVSADGYAPLTVTRDFRRADAFPLDFALEPLPREEAFVWVDAANMERVLPTLAIDPHSRRLIADAIAERPGTGALVPTFAVVAPDGPVDAWIEISTATGEAWPRLGDGLYGSSLAGTILSKAAPKPYAAQQQAISYFAGRIAAWYLWAAGALEAVGTKMDHPAMTLAEMHRHASRTARALAGIYDTWALKIPGNPVVKGGAFEKGLKDGLAWADKLYAEAWRE